MKLSDINAIIANLESNTELMEINLKKTEELLYQINTNYDVKFENYLLELNIICDNHKKKLTEHKSNLELYKFLFNC